MSVQPNTYDIQMYHLYGLPLERGAECTFSEAQQEFAIVSNGETFRIQKDSILDLYIQVEKKNIERDEEDPQKSILSTMLNSNFFYLSEYISQKKIDRMTYENLVIVMMSSEGEAEVSLRVPVQDWVTAELLADRFQESRCNTECQKP